MSFRLHGELEIALSHAHLLKPADQAETLHYGPGRPFSSEKPCIAGSARLRDNRMVHDDVDRDLQLKVKGQRYRTR